MKGFFQLIGRREFMKLLARFEPLEREETGLDGARGRIVFENIRSPEDLPPFSRSTMDGFAVRAKDTFGCSESEPALLNIVGEIPMGTAGDHIEIRPGQTAKIWTGGALPKGADSVVMVEYTHLVDPETIEVFRPVAPGENVILQGEDFREGEIVFNAGHELRSQDIGVLAGLGITRIPVFRRPRVAIISTGDELVPPERRPAPGQIRDINSTTLASQVEEAGGIALKMGIIRDDPETMLEACQEALDSGADILLLSGGSSVGRRDFTLTVFEAIPGTEVLAHGVSIRPGKPTILAKRGNQALFGLPGHVASAMVVFYLFVRPLVRFMSGRELSIGLPEVLATCSQEIPSVSGREDFVRVRLQKLPDQDLPEAFPVWGRSGLLRPLVKADGLLIVPRDSEGLEKGERARVLLFSPDGPF
jgi:molybdopterin molybdotransferase